MVDPATAEPVISALEGRPLNYILNTHHHADHVGANLTLKKRYGCKIIGSGYDPERIPGMDVGLKEGELCHIGAAQAHILFLPGHTRGHIAFYFPQSEALFCGDTLFAGGCGRLFEGTATQMFASLEKIKHLPDATKVYCAHEYTLTNYKFATQQEPKNKALQKRLNEVQNLRKEGKPTVPTTLKEEKATNIFLKAETATLFSALRSAKDAF